MKEYEEHRWPYEYIYTEPFYIALFFRISKQLWMKEPSAKRISKFSCNSSHMALSISFNKTKLQLKSLIFSNSLTLPTKNTGLKNETRFL